MASPIMRHPVFLGLTRPPMFGGLPFTWWVALAMGTLVLFLASGTLLAWAAALPLWLACRLGVRIEPRFFDLFAVALSRTPPTPNRALWGGDSYGP
jgi:type IV secretion system protein VirB3